MTDMEQWQAVSGRVRGLIQAGCLYGQFLAARSGDPYGNAERLRVQCVGILDAIRGYRAQCQQGLSLPVLAAIDRFVEEHQAMFMDGSGSQDSKRARAEAALLALAAFDSEVSFLLSSSQQFIRRRSERAFAHLQRTIVADPAVRANWQQAFEKGEVACEKLGACHLLAHGIWGFKVNAAGERTDLVYQEPLAEREVERGADGLVLTEWKLMDGGGDATRQFEAARAQARRYARGALGGLELADWRYAVVVTRGHVDPPDDEFDGVVVYRNVNIAVDPAPPSRGSRDGL